jgi:ATP-binding cassette subfamily C protein
MSVNRGKSTLREQIKSCFAILSAKDRRYLTYIVGIQVSIGVFDLVSLGLMGVLGALAISGVQSNTPSSQVIQILGVLNLQDSDFQFQVAMIASLTAILLVTKTLFSLYFSRRIIFYLSTKGANVSAKLIDSVSKLPLSDIKRYSEQSLLFAISSGVNVVLIGIIAASCNLVTDFSLLIMLSIALFAIDPIIALLSILLFGSTALALYVATRQRALRYGQMNSQMNIASNTAILNLFALYRELTVRNRKSTYVEDIAKIRIELARAIGEINFLPNLSKYIMEVTLVLGGFVIVGVELAIHDAVTAAGALAVFLTAATRITPALLRVQQSATGIKNSLGMAAPTLDILYEMEKMDLESQDRLDAKIVDTTLDSEFPEIEFSNVTFNYFDSTTPAINSLQLKIKANEMIALVGPSGSGKSTFVDLLLGIIKPTQGEIRIRGASNLHSIKSDDFQIGYVPQNVAIIEGTLRENMTFGFKRGEFSDNQIWAALELAELQIDLEIAGIMLNTPLGPGGMSLSGGQKQRLGIARAILVSPRILVMDEATSALDSETEAKLNRSIQKMKGSTTLVIIAHRLSSVMNADTVVYLDRGRIIASGNFSEVRRLVPEFDLQARLMGL